MNKTLYFVVLCVLAIPQIACGQIQQNNIETKSHIKNEEPEISFRNFNSQADEFCKAIVNDDFKKAFAYSHPKIFEKLGMKNNDEIIAFLKDSSDEMKADGFEIEKLSVGEIIQTTKIEDSLFAVAKVFVTIKVPEGKVGNENPFVGISNDGGVNWKFLYGIGQVEFSKLFPKAAEVIKLPAEQNPKPIEN